MENFTGRTINGFYFSFPHKLDMVKKIPPKGHFTVSFVIRFKVIICKAFRKLFTKIQLKITPLISSALLKN